MNFKMNMYLMTVYPFYDDRATVVRNHREFWVNMTSPILKDVTLVPTTMAAMSAANNSSCSEPDLEKLSESRPGVAILCYQDSHCPCGWVCCPQCQSTLAICRQPRSSKR